MNHFSAKSRITIGLAGLLASVMCAAVLLGMLPDRTSAILEGRASLCESIAVASSDYISRGEVKRLNAFLETIVDRNPDVLSAGVRRTSGDLITELGDHVSQWNSDASSRSTETQVHVPVYSRSGKWGSIELRFEHATPQNTLWLFRNPWVRISIWVTGACYLLFYWYLGKMLKHLDPSKTVPKRVRAALDSLAEGLLVIDREQRIVLANRSFADWIGQPPEKVIGSLANKLNWVQDEQKTPLTNYPWVAALDEQKPQAGVMMGIVNRAEQVQTLIANASPVLGVDGKYRGVLVSFDDVTQLEKTKRDLHVAKQFADDANKAKSDFLARMSHEIRTPMNAILGYTEVLQRGYADDEAQYQQHLCTIHDSGEHLLALINDILDLSKIESNRFELELREYSPHLLILQVIETLDIKASQKNIELVYEPEGELPDVILMDTVRLRQAIINLVGNAIKFTEKGCVKIKAKLIPGEKTLLGIEIQDSGIGISQDAIARIFEPFAQADTSITRQFGGTGLGLSICLQLAKKMGGEVKVTSELGKGSQFLFTLDPGPIGKVSQVDQHSVRELAAKQRAAKKHDTLKLPKSRILVVDDGEANRQLASLFLKRAGAVVETAENGKIAVEMASAKHYDAILMDMQMPVMDGVTATREISRLGIKTPIIALTANVMHDDEVKCREAGCVGFLEKPIKMERLIETLTKIFVTNKPRSFELDSMNSEVEVIAAGEQTTEELSPARSNASSTRRASAVEPALVSASTSQTHNGRNKASMNLGNPSSSDDSRNLSAKSISLNTASNADTQRQFAEHVPAVQSSLPPIESFLPMDDLEIYEIVADFTERLRGKIVEMRSLLEQGEFAMLRELAHWLKGAGETVGFREMTPPAAKLEAHAKQNNFEECNTHLREIESLTGRIRLPDPPTG
jgi:PAS domain S-box-containing protein